MDIDSRLRGNDSMGTCFLLTLLTFIGFYYIIYIQKLVIASEAMKRHIRHCERAIVYTGERSNLGIRLRLLRRAFGAPRNDGFMLPDFQALYNIMISY